MFPEMPIRSNSNASTAFLIALAVLTAQALTSHAFPALFLAKTVARDNCSAVPQAEYGRHGAPQLDPNVTFTLTGQNGNAAIFVCPGDSYLLRVNFTKPSYYVMTVPEGYALGKSIHNYVFDSCENRAASSLVSIPVKSVRKWIQVSCEATGPLVVVTLSAGGSSDYFHSATLEVPLSPDCVAADCTM